MAGRSGIARMDCIFGMKKINKEREEQEQGEKNNVVDLLILSVYHEYLGQYYVKTGCLSIISKEVINQEYPGYAAV